MSDRDENGMIRQARRNFGMYIPILVFWGVSRNGLVMLYGRWWFRIQGSAIRKRGFQFVNILQEIFINAALAGQNGRPSTKAIGNKGQLVLLDKDARERKIIVSDRKVKRIQAIAVGGLRVRAAQE
jgi:hypothetical protein